MNSSSQWAQERLKQANLIFEPAEKTWQTQLGNFLVWGLECGLIWLLARYALP